MPQRSPAAKPPRVAAHCPGAQPLHGLAGDLGYYLEVFIEVQDRESSQFGGRCEDQVRYGRRAVLAAVASKVSTSAALSSIAGVRYQTGMDDSGGCRHPARSSRPDRAA